MSTTIIWNKCNVLGITLSAEDGELVIVPSENIPPKLAKQIRENKAALIEELQFLDRTEKYKTALLWLHEQATDSGVQISHPAYTAMTDALDTKYDKLNDAWIDAGDEEFLIALREYAGAGLRGLRGAA